MTRKPYLTKQPNNWYITNNYYIAYILREFTSIPVGLSALNLFWGITAIASSPEAWHSWISFQHSPLVFLFNIIAFIAAIYNTITWFEAMPKAVRIQYGTQFIPDSYLIWISWGGFIMIFLILFFVILLVAG